MNEAAEKFVVNVVKETPTIGKMLENWLLNNGVNESFIIYLKGLIIVVLMFIASYLLFLIARKIIVRILHFIAKRTETTWDDVMIEKRVFHRLAYIAPAIFIHSVIPVALVEFAYWTLILQAILKIYMVVIVVMVLDSFFESIVEIYHGYEIAKFKPIKGYVQIARIIVYLVAAIFIISALIGKSPVYLLTGLGALSAVLMLIFKDTLLGFVASIQLSANDMIRPGDWITMSKFGADGIVHDINLTTVKIENFDKTITTVPTYSFIADSFQNWRGMEESGVRRIKRSININVNSVKFCNEEMLSRFSKFKIIRDYINQTQRQLEEFNQLQYNESEDPVNDVRQTNLGVFRAYLYAYLRNNPHIDQEKTLLVRQLAPTEKGLPVEIYAFSKVQEWEKYENIISDIFDHVLAFVPQFELQIFQNPTGADFKMLGQG
jgi:miniconductance mechanosensitive channel